MTPRNLFITLSNIGDAVLTTPALRVLHDAFPDHRIDIVADPRSAGLFEHCPFLGELFLLRKRLGWPGRLALVRRLRKQHYDVAVERHLAVVRPLLSGPPPPTRAWLGGAERDWAARMLARLPGRRWLAIAPGANWPPKIWPLQYFQELLERLRDQFDAAIVCGGPNDFAPAAALTRASPLPALNLAGETSLLQAAAVLERAAYFVGNDSGPGHLAAAVGTPTLTLFGPGEPERYHPWAPGAQWLCAPEQDLKRLAPATVAARILAGRPQPASAS